jgi:hypothetical protein
MLCTTGVMNLKLGKFYKNRDTTLLRDLLKFTTTRL